MFLRASTSGHGIGRQRSRSSDGFTLLEMLVVMTIIAIVALVLLPAVGTQSGRSIDAAARQFQQDLDNARLTAIAERTRTRILLPQGTGDFTGATSGTPWPIDVGLRGYVLTSANRTDVTWQQRGKWNRLPDGVAIDSTFAGFPTPAPASPNMDIAATKNGTKSYTYTGSYIEFLANGSCNLDPTVAPQTIKVADGFVNPTGFVAKNASLYWLLTVDPLSGSVVLSSK